MTGKQSLQPAHGRWIRLEISIAGRQTTFSGQGRYVDGKLWVDVPDDSGSFSICLDEAKFDGQMRATGGSLLIRLTAQQ
jgi:hypothetical protein